MAQKDELANTLEQIGLSEKEARVYLALLSLESSTAYEIAQHCDVKKPTVYVILEELRRKGLALKVPHAKKALYAARDISEYLSEQRGKLNAVQSIVPHLMSLGGSGKPNVYFFSGINGLRDALNYKFDAMRDKTFRSFYGDLADADKKVLQLYREHDPRAVAAGISYEIIMAKQSSSEKYQHLRDLADKKQQMHIKFLEKYTYPGSISIEIGDGFVRIDDAKRVTATVIEDKATAEAMRQIFNIVWEKGE
jgi:DNA-binding MarR family transcriptional regulator